MPEDPSLILELIRSTGIKTKTPIEGAQMMANAAQTAGLTFKLKLIV